MALHDRLADMNAAETVFDVLLGNPRVTGVGDAEYQIDIQDGWVLTFCQNHVKEPKTDAKVDWKKVNRIQILKIEK